MDTTHPARRSSLRRLFERAGLALGALVALSAAACGGKVVVDGGSGESGGGGSGGGAGSATSTGSGCALTSTGSSGTDVQVTECIGEVDGKCPNQYQATMYITPSVPCSYVVSVDCGPVAQAGTCCYLVTEQGGACP
jgi:hypothetical protein